MSLRPGTFLSYATSIIFVFGAGFILYTGYLAIQPVFFIIAWIIFSSIAISIPCFLTLKLYAMYLNDVHGPIGGVTTKTSTEDTVRQKIVKALPGRK